MAEWKRAQWRKAHGELATSPSHVGIGPNARALLLTLIPLAWWDEQSPEGRMLESPDPCDGTPLPKLYRMSDLTKRHGDIALGVLCRVQTVAIWEGVVVLPKFARWQRGESTERTRRHKARSVPGTALELFPEREKQTADSRQQTADPLAALGDARALEAEQVVGRLVERRTRMQLPVLSARELDPKHILARLADGVPLEDLLDVVDLQAELAARDPDKAGFLSATRLFSGPNANGKSGGWEVSRSMLDKARARSASPSSSAAQERAKAEYQAEIRRLKELRRQQQERTGG